MAQVHARVERRIAAPPERVLAFLGDLPARRRILPDNYSEIRAESADVLAYHFVAGRRRRDYRLHVERLDHALHERDEGSSFTHTWTVVADGAGSRVSLSARWDGASGLAGFFERTFAPLGLRRIYTQILARLEAEVTAGGGAGPAAGAAPDAPSA